MSSFVRNYRIATGTYLFTRPERRAWDIVFIILLVLFTIGFISLTINTYRSFGRLLWGDGKKIPNVTPINEATTGGN